MQDADWQKRQNDKQNEKFSCDREAEDLMINSVAV